MQDGKEVNAWNVISTCYPEVVVYYEEKFAGLSAKVRGWGTYLLSLFVVCSLQRFFHDTIVDVASIKGRDLFTVQTIQQDMICEGPACLEGVGNRRRGEL